MPPGPAPARPPRRLRLAGRGNAALSLASGRRAVWVSTSSACSVRALRHCFRRERRGESGTASGPKPSPLLPVNMGKGLKQRQMTRAKGRVPLVTLTVHSSPSPCVRPPPAQKVVRVFPPMVPPWAGGDVTSGLWGDSSAFLCTGTGGSCAIPGAVPAAMLGLSSGVAPAASPRPAPGGAKGGGQSWLSPPDTIEGRERGVRVRVAGARLGYCPGAACVT